MLPLVAAAICLLHATVAAPNRGLNERATSPYAPVKAACPSTPLVRPANGISSSEQSYVRSRKPIADAALQSFLATTNSGFGNASSYPTIALTSSGGGLRALLCSAGVHQAFDNRDGTFSTSGIYQAVTFESGLSGGAWLLGSITGNNWPTISSLKTGLWEKSFQDGLIAPDGVLVAVADADIVTDIVAKQDAGYSPTLTDPYGRLLGYLLLEQSRGGVADTLSGLTSASSFISHSVPFPIITSIGADSSTGQCVPPANGIQYELSPYEFGSWDSGVQAFTQTKYLGSFLSNGQPTVSGQCESNYDNLGFVMGTSSNVFNEVCLSDPTLPGELGAEEAEIQKLLNSVHAVTTKDDYATYPNPFHNYAASSRVSGMTDLTLVDGGESNQNNPIWPFLHRSVDVLLVSDNSADTSDNYPNGTEIYNTYIQAQADGLSKMPVIPPVSTFVSEGLNKRPTFFGCNSPSTVTIVYLPNVNYTFDSGQSTARLEYVKSDTDAMISNGNLIGTYDNNATWATCLGCAIMKKSGSTLPSACTKCFSTFCYN